MKIKDQAVALEEVEYCRELGILHTILAVVRKVGLMVALVMKLVKTAHQEVTQVNQAVVVAGVQQVAKAIVVLLHLPSVRVV